MTLIPKLPQEVRFRPPVRLQQKAYTLLMVILLHTVLSIPLMVNLTPSMANWVYPNELLQTMMNLVYPTELLQTMVNLHLPELECTVNLNGFDLLIQGCPLRACGLVKGKLRWV